MRYLIFLVYFFLICCNKEEIKPSTFYEKYPKASQSPLNKVWTLYDAKVFIEDLDGNTFTYYDHFGVNQTESNLDVFNTTFLPIDNIIKNVTTWQFSENNKKFTLNNVLVYDFEVLPGVYKVIGLENGSSRIMEIISGYNDFISFKIYESYGNSNNSNFKFYTILTFTSNPGITPIIPSVPYGYEYGGLINLGSPVQTLAGTTWVLTNYLDNLTNITVNDTITFISETEYIWNNSTPKNYSLSGIVGNNMKSLSLYNFTTFNGDWSGQIQSTFISDGVIQNATFVDLMNNQPDKRVWMQKI